MQDQDSGIILYKYINKMNSRFNILKIEVRFEGKFNPTG